MSTIDAPGPEQQPDDGSAVTLTPVPWTESLIGRSRRLLGAGLAAALITSGVTLYLARDDGQPRYPVAATSTQVPLAGATFTLVGLHQQAELPGRYEATKPVTGATFVVAEVDADLSASPRGCLLYLMAGDYSFSSENGYSPSDTSASATCTPGRTGRVSMAFQVPNRLLDQVDGLRVEVPTETIAEQVILPGHPS